MNIDIEYLQQILKDDPSNFQARRELSIALADMGFNEEALVNFKYLRKYFPNDADIHYNIGIIQEKLKKFNEAKKSYKKAIEISPQSDFFYNLSEVLITLEDWDNAIEAIENVLKKDFNDGNSYFNLGLCYFNKNEYNIAIDKFIKATEINKNDLYAYFYMGNAYRKVGITNFAHDCYNKVLEISPDYSWAYFNIASIAYEQGDFEKCKENLELTINYNKFDIEAYKLLVKISIKLNEIENVLTLLHNQLKNTSENGDIAYLLSQVYKFIIDKDNYIKFLNVAISHPLSLSYPISAIKKELNNALLHNKMNAPKEFEEYEIDNDIEEEADDNNINDNNDDFEYDENDDYTDYDDE